MSEFEYPLLQTLWKNQFFSTTLIFITLLHLLLVNWKVWRRKSEHKLFFSVDIETTIRIKLRSISEKLTQHHIRREQARRSDMSEDDSANNNKASFHFLQIQKNQTINLQESLEPSCKNFTFVWFQERRNGLNLIKSYFIPFPVN